MPRLHHLLVLPLCALALAGCCRDTFREMAKYTLRPDAEPVRKAERRSSEHRAKSVAASASEIETGSVKEQSPGPDCQGEHLAYQATREYLMLVGPKPQGAAGEQGPCAAAAAPKN
jgi:membrane protein required for beta-lactamase induction